MTGDPDISGNMLVVDHSKIPKSIDLFNCCISNGSSIKNCKKKIHSNITKYIKTPIWIWPEELPDLNLDKYLPKEYHNQ